MSIENKLQRAFQASTPDVLNNVLQQCNSKKVTAVPVRPRKRNWFTNIACAAAILALVFCVGLFQYQQHYTVAATVSLDVNPSVEIQINKESKVLRATAINDDGKRILNNFKLKGMALDEAVSTLLNAMVENGYLNESANSVLISVDGINEDSAAALQDRITTNFSQVLGQQEFEGAVIVQTVEKDDELKQQAGDSHISVGKAMLIQRILQQDNRYTFEELSKLSINELNLLTESGKLDLDKVSSSGSASAKKYIGKDTAKDIALQHAQLEESNVVCLNVHMDSEDGMMVYEVRFNTATNRYEYEINATSGEILESECELIDDSESEETEAPSNKSESITKDAAIEAAMAHAQCDGAEEVSCKLDKEHGKLIYKINFISGGYRFRYLIDAENGTVISYEKSQESKPELDNSVKLITEEDAKQIALDHAQVTDPENYACKLDQDHGTTVYRIRFASKDQEFSYVVDAVSGSIVCFDKDTEPHHNIPPRGDKDPHKPEMPEADPTGTSVPSTVKPEQNPASRPQPTSPSWNHDDDLRPDEKPTCSSRPNRPEDDDDDDDDEDKVLPQTRPTWESVPPTTRPERPTETRPGFDDDEDDAQPQTRPTWESVPPTTRPEDPTETRPGFDDDEDDAQPQTRPTWESVPPTTRPEAPTETRPGFDNDEDNAQPQTRPTWESVPPTTRPEAPTETRPGFDNDEDNAQPQTRPTWESVPPTTRPERPVETRPESDDEEHRQIQPAESTVPTTQPVTRNDRKKDNEAN